jgi:hypothetical protein
LTYGEEGEEGGQFRLSQAEIVGDRVLHLRKTFTIKEVDRVAMDVADVHGADLINKQTSHLTRDLYLWAKKRRLSAR